MRSPSRTARRWTRLSVMSSGHRPAHENESTTGHRSTFLGSVQFTGSRAGWRVGLPSSSSSGSQPFMLSEAPVPNGVQKSIALGRYDEAAAQLTRLAADRPSIPILVALASVNLQ